MADAQKGLVEHQPNVPFIAPRSDVQSVMPPQPGQTTPPAQPEPPKGNLP